MLSNGAATEYQGVILSLRSGGIDRKEKSSDVLFRCQPFRLLIKDFGSAHFSLPAMPISYLFLQESGG